ncbi:MAG: hypothetical protein JOZ45_23215 [Acidobacteriaceae bacterium]|nr:hypothetical protein [Acidobacteriaceae bacterium]MBV9940012.1 hypothetical protein [Acidobacteriaceae bacterium]
MEGGEKLLLSIGAGFILSVASFVGGVKVGGGDELRDSIKRYVAATGNGSITCTFEDTTTQVTFNNQRLDQLDPKFRAAVAEALNRGACVASLPQEPTPKLTTTTGNSKPTNG